MTDEPEYTPNECGWNVVHGMAQQASLLAELDDSMLRTRLAERVAEQVEKAVLEMRERCARTADAYADDPEGGLGSPEEEAAAHAIAARIRSITPHGGEDRDHDSQTIPR